MRKAKELHDKKSEHAEAMRALVNKAEAEDRSMTDEEVAEFDKHSADFDELDRELRRLNRIRELDEIEERRRAEASDRTGTSEDELEERIRDYNLSYSRFLRFGAGAESGISLEDREVLRRGLPYLTEEENAKVRAEYRQQATTPGAVGGYTVSPELMRGIVEFMAAYGGIESAAQVITTTTGAILPYPLMDTSGEEGVIVAENASVGEQQDQYDQREFSAFKYSSRRVRLPYELIQDSNIDIVGVTAQRIGTRLGRIMSKHVANGSGSGQPEGLIVAAPIGKALAAAQVIGYDDLIDLVHSVDPAYRSDPSCRFVMHDSVLALLRKIKTASDQVPLWQPAITQGEPDRIVGYPYIVDQGCNALAAGLSRKLMAFGALSYFLIRRVMAMMVVQQRETLAEFGQVGYIGFARMDAGGLWSSTKEAGSPADAAIPVKTIANPAA